MMEYNISCDSSKNIDFNIKFNDDITYIISLKQLIKIVNSDIKWKYNELLCKHIFYYTKNRKIISIIEFLYDNYQNTNMNLEFKNKNKYDLRPENVNIYHYKNDEIVKKYNVLEYIPGHIIKIGKESGYMKNPIWKINDNNDIYYIMYCEDNKIIKLCETSLNRINNYEVNNNEKLTFYYQKNYDQQCFTHSSIYKKLNIKNVIMDKIKDVSNIYQKNNDITDFRYDNLYIEGEEKEEIKDKHLNIHNIKPREITKKIIKKEKITNNYETDNIKVNRKYKNQIMELKKIYKKITLYDWAISKKAVDGCHFKNPIWKVRTDNEKYYIMYCEKDTFIKLCSKSLKSIYMFKQKYNNNNDITFNMLASGYCQSNNIESINKKLLLHQIIMNHYGNGQGTMNTSIDHINRDPLDNRYNNLKIATRQEQEANKTRTGRTRSKMPEGFIEENFPKYVEYCTEKLPSGLMRESFRISKTGTPLEKHWYTSKSVKISIKDKYDKMIEKYKSVFGDELLKDVILYK